MSENTHTTAVLIVGGSLVGTSMALFLGSLGVQALVVEKHSGTIKHPRALGWTARTSEFFRAFDIADRLPPAVPWEPIRARVISLAGEWFERSAWTPDPSQQNSADYSPCTGRTIPQDHLEPIMREAAIGRGAEFRFNTELMGFDQDATGVTAHLKERNGKEYDVCAAYLVSADGAKSPVREALGTPREGRGRMNTLSSVLFRAELDEYLKEGVTQFTIDQGDLKAFLIYYCDDRWALMFGDGKDRDEATLRSAIAKAIGRDDIAFEIITTARWELSALVAETFSSDRVFLAGDSAHTFPPTRGGYGANTGIQDAHNLAWKLAEVLAGRATPDLLKTYSDERQPAAWLRHQQIFARPDYKAFLTPDQKQDPIIHDDAMEFGQLYRSPGIVGAGPELPAALKPDEWAGQPGTRAPHLWLRQDGAQLSTLDLLHNRWTLLTQEEGWQQAVTAARETFRVEVDFCCLDAGSLAPELFQRSFGVGPGGAALIRPDGYIAWRAQQLPREASAVLADALAKVSFTELCHPGVAQVLTASLA